MVKEFLQLGGRIEKADIIRIRKSTSITVYSEDKEWTANVCVLAIPSEAIKRIMNMPVLKHLQMNPLVRMYAVFPKGNWFLSKIVTANPIRYFIPLNSNTVMISYTDGKDAEYWLRQPKESIQAKVMKYVREWYPDLPDPVFFKIHRWREGCTYWLPGKYDVEEASYQSLHPFPDYPLFVTGESFSPTPCWMESALSQNEKLLRHPAFINELKKETKHHIS
jgi:monoamine oxidase